MDTFDLMQWPAMVLTLLAAWLVASSKKPQRNVGFWIFLLSNAFWIIWAVGADAPALIALQIGLAAMNIRGAIKSNAAHHSQGAESST